MSVSSTLFIETDDSLIIDPCVYIYCSKFKIKEIKFLPYVGFSFNGFATAFSPLKALG